MPVETHEIVESLHVLLNEVFGEPSTEWRYFSDPSKVAGFFGLMEELSAEQAGLVVLGSSVAAQIQHATFVMDVACDLVRGQPRSPAARQWEASWNTGEIEAVKWRRLREAFRASTERLRDHVRDHATQDVESFTHAVGVLAHLAYHLGAVKQKVAAVSKK